MRAALASLALAFGLVWLASMDSAWAAAPLTQTNTTGPVTVAVTPLPHAPGESLALKVVLDTHSVGLDAIALDRAIAVRASGGLTAPLRLESAKGSGHHREAVLVFAPSVLAEGATALEVIVTDIGGVPERLFRWDLPFAAAQTSAPQPPQAGPVSGAGPSGAGTMAPGPTGPGMPGGGMPGGGMMGPGMMAGMRQQMMGMMQQMGGMMQLVGELMATGTLSPEQTKQVGELLQQMGGMMGSMGPMGGTSGAPGAGPARPGPGGMPDMSQMMERMAEMQKQMAEMQRRLQDATGAPR